MYIVELAASDPRLAGAIAQSPLVDGLAAATMVPPPRSLRLRLLALAVADRLGPLLGRPPIYLPGAGAPGKLAVGSTPDALFGQELMTPKDSTQWHNRVAARSLLSFSWRRPVRRAAAIRCPIMLVVAEHDTMAPVAPALRVAQTAPRQRAASQPRRPLRRLPGRRKLRRRAARRGRIPPHARQDPNAVSKCSKQQPSGV